MMTMKDNSRDRNSPDALDPATAKTRQRMIGDKLRNLFDDVVEEGVPETFSDLLDRLDKSASGNPSNSESSPRPKEG